MPKNVGGCGVFVGVERILMIGVGLTLLFVTNIESNNGLLSTSCATCQPNLQGLQPSCVCKFMYSMTPRQRSSMCVAFYIVHTLHEVSSVL